MTGRRLKMHDQISANSQPSLHCYFGRTNQKPSLDLELHRKLPFEEILDETAAACTCKTMLAFSVALSKLLRD